MYRADAHGLLALVVLAAAAGMMASLLYVFARPNLIGAVAAVLSNWKL
jgi:hypothetical protein